MPPKRRREATPDGRAVQPSAADNAAVAATPGAVTVTDAAGAALAQSSNLNFAVTLNNESNQIILDKLAELSNAIIALQRAQKEDAESQRKAIGSLRDENNTLSQQVKSLCQQVESLGEQVKEQGQTVKSIRGTQTKQGTVLKDLRTTSDEHHDTLKSIKATAERLSEKTIEFNKTFAFGHQLQTDNIVAINRSLSRDTGKAPLDYLSSRITSTYSDTMGHIAGLKRNGSIPPILINAKPLNISGLGKDDDDYLERMGPSTNNEDGQSGSSTPQGGHPTSSSSPVLRNYCPIWYATGKCGDTGCKYGLRHVCRTCEINSTPADHHQDKCPNPRPQPPPF